MLAQLSGSTIFSKLDANNGFWQIPLSEESKKLYSFITPFGRYEFNKLPFGISSAPELFQKRMSKILAGLEVVVCQIDDVLIYGQDWAEHNKRLYAALDRIRKSGATLNADKCEFRRTSIKYLGHIIDSNGIQADPGKILALQDMIAPSNITELRRVLWIVNQLGKFANKNYGADPTFETSAQER
jgi:hypothetical protein